MVSNSIRNQLEQYLIENQQIVHLNINELGKLFGVSRQYIHNLLNQLGETRHHRIPAKPKYCLVCEKKITSRANYCRYHAKAILREAGKSYICRICKQDKPLELFAKSNVSFSGYETRCLDCRAEWQRNYYKTDIGKDSHVKTTRAWARKYPERHRAYNLVSKALREGTIKRETCYNCNSEDSQAIHRDYNDPLNIIWSCITCRSTLLDSIPVPEYKLNEIEEKYRDFIGNILQKPNSVGMWIQSLKRHYDVLNIDNELLITAIKEHKHIKGLGSQFKTVTSQFLNLKQSLT